jgi:2-oxoacid:acceptor oxidoreductase gamma subunit (pyruvate/2-ketoisovalerate family)
MIEARFHGRGGQGAVMASRILAGAFVKKGKYGASFPMFGFERRGAPVTAFSRVDDKPVNEKTKIYQPDVVVVLDTTQIGSKSTREGMKNNSVMVLNSPSPVFETIDPHVKTIGTVDAQGISLEEIGVAIPNTCIMGAFAKITGIIEIDWIVKSLEDYFSNEKLKANIRCTRRGYEDSTVYTF